MLMSSSACMGCGWECDIHGSPCGVIDDDHGRDCCWYFLRCVCHLGYGFLTSWMTGMRRAFRVNLTCVWHDPLWQERTWLPLVNSMRQFLQLTPHILDWARVATTHPQLSAASKVRRQCLGQAMPFVNGHVNKDGPHSGNFLSALPVLPWCPVPAFVLCWQIGQMVPMVVGWRRTIWP